MKTEELKSQIDSLELALEVLQALANTGLTTDTYIPGTIQRAITDLHLIRVSAMLEVRQWERSVSQRWIKVPAGRPDPRDR